MNKRCLLEVEKDAEEGNFFENVLVSAKQELKKERLEEKRRERANNIEEVISLAQAQVNYVKCTSKASRFLEFFLL